MSGLAAGELKVRIAGIGGQGAVLLGDVLGHAAMLAGLNSAMSTVYGSQARGGASRSDVIISPEQIDFPHVVSPQALVALAQDPYDENRSALERGGTIVYDEFFVSLSDHDLESGSAPDPEVRLYGVSATRIVMDRLGSARPVNFYMLGATVGLLDELEPLRGRPLDRAVELKVRKRFVEVNRCALHMGIEQGMRLREDR